MSVKTNTIWSLWPGDEHQAIRLLAMQRAEITKAVQEYCRQQRTGRTPKFNEFFAATKAAVEAAFVAGERQIVRTPQSGGCSRGDRLRGEDERHSVDSYWGGGTYDNEFTTDEMIDEAFG